jgi:hypothetical protein
MLFITQFLQALSLQRSVDSLCSRHSMPFFCLSGAVFPVAEEWTSHFLQMSFVL